MVQFEPDDLGAAINGVLADARRRLAPLALAAMGHAPSDHDYRVQVWRQSWPDTTCGFPGIGGQAFTSAYTVLVSVDGDPPCAVYHDFRLARVVAIPSGEFHRRVKDRRLPGAASDWLACERIVEPDGYPLTPEPGR